ncbi:hypothetical protein K438DRAFT_1877924 [Mycena galopus ATCC 62051]|nr:hypothetical protein K438DRAFT_1877924 [Mycena galopus ATCC 62051]
MHLLWLVLGVVVGSIEGLPVNAPPQDSLDAICDGLTAATAIASQAVALRSHSSPNPEIEGLRSELLTALSDAGTNFRLSLERGEAYARAGNKVANNVIYVLDRFVLGKLEKKHIPDVARSLEKPITQLLDNAIEMQAHFGAVQTDLEKVQMKTQTHGQRVDRAITEAQDAINKSRRRRKRSNIFAGAMAAVCVVFPPAAPAAIGLGTAQAIEGDLQHKAVVAGLATVQSWHAFADNLITIRGVVGRAQDVTADQIRFWSQTRDQIARLSDSSADWLEDLSSEWMVEKLLAEWKGVAQQYSQCAYATSDTHRFLDAHLQ